MITEFCMSCGAKYEYSLEKPKFCSSCGTPLGGNLAKANVEESKSNNNEKNDILPNISKLEYSISKSLNNQTFGDLISEASRGGSVDYEKAPPRPSPSYDSSEDLIQDTMKQCRSKREPEDLGDKG